MNRSSLMSNSWKTGLLLTKNNENKKEIIGK